MLELAGQVQQVGRIDPRQRRAINRNLERSFPAAAQPAGLPPPRPPLNLPPPAVAGQAPNPGAGGASRFMGLMKSKNFKRNALIGAGVVAAASVVGSRRGEGSSKGRQSNYRY